jgi:hypothetical protein
MVQWPPVIETGPASQSPDFKPIYRLKSTIGQFAGPNAAEQPFHGGIYIFITNTL